MDCKIAGTDTGITGFQLDLKLKGIPYEIMEEAIGMAKKARTAILANMGDCLAKEREEMSPYAPRIVTIPIDPSKIGELIGPGAILYWDQLVYKKPETDEEFPWHQDNGYTFVSPEAYLTCWVPLTEATEENGCPWVIPGAHRLGTLKHWSTPLGLQCVNSTDDLANPPAAVEASPGDIVVFSSLTPHRTGPHLTDACRKAFILQYAAGGAVMHSRGGDPIQLPFDARRHISMAIA